MTILVLGSNGMAGSMIVRRLTDLGHAVTGISRNKIDILNSNWSEKLGAQVNDIVINCIGLIPQKVRMDAENESKFMYCNGDFSQALAKFCQQRQARLIHLSTNCVFKGGSKCEDDVPDADDIYGRSKAAGEPVSSALVLRCSIIGPEKGTAVSLLEWALSQRQTRGYTNHAWNGITTLELANLIHAFIRDGFDNGLLHLYSSNTMSKFDLIKELYTIWGHDGIVVPFETEKPYDKTLTSNSFAPTKTIQEQLRELWEYQQPRLLQRLNSSPFPHMVQDNFLEERFATALQNEILSLSAELFDRYQNPFEAKFTLRDKFNLPSQLSKLFTYWTSDLFLHELSTLTGYNLFNDLTRNFCGVHLYDAGDKLDIHVDAGLHPTTKQKKHVTVGLYLSYNYREGDGCELELWSGSSAGQANPTLNKCEQRIAPLFNRLVVFVNNDYAWHGNPRPLTGDGCRRIFVTISFLSEEYDDMNKREKALFVKRPEDPEDAEKDRLRLLRADPDKYKEVYRV
jgi:dTDP-4-dehydrorhamnose reductase